MMVREAQPEDVPAVGPMVRAICKLHESWDPDKYGFRPEDPAEMYRQWLMRQAISPRAVFLVGEREPGKLVGFLIGTVELEIPVYRIREYGFIHDIWVEPAYRHEGIGRQLVMRAVERFQEIGVPQIRLDTAWQNEISRAMFRSCGFREAMVQMLAVLPRADRETP